MRKWLAWPHIGPRPPICQNSHSATATRSRSRFAAEAPGLAREILQDRAGFEHRNRLAVGPVGIDDRGHAIVRRDGEKGRLELLARADVDQCERVGQAALFEHDGDLPSVRRRPVVELDRFCGLVIAARVRSRGLADRRTPRTPRRRAKTAPAAPASKSPRSFLIQRPHAAFGRTGSRVTDLPSLGRFTHERLIRPGENAARQA